MTRERLIPTIAGKNVIVTHSDVAKAIGGHDRKACAALLNQIDYWRSISGKTYPGGGDHLWFYKTIEQGAKELDCSHCTDIGIKIKGRSMIVDIIAPVAHPQYDEIPLGYTIGAAKKKVL